MPQTYKATGINLKAMPLGEHDRLLTILTREHGLLRVVAPGARKHRSGMAGRSALFVINDLSIARGRSLDRIQQAETLQSFIGLSQRLLTLTAAQYLAELVLAQALSAQPQTELFDALVNHLSRLVTSAYPLAHLSHGIYHLLEIAGFAPQVRTCGVTQQPVIPHRDRQWRIGFSPELGGVVGLAAVDGMEGRKPRLTHRLAADEWEVLQALPLSELPEAIAERPTAIWLAIERLLRGYAQYHLDKPIQSADLIEKSFAL